jgi:hypothetical protein
MSNSMRLGTVGAELFYADGRTDKTKLIAIFRNFANAPKNVYRHTIMTPLVLVSCEHEQTFVKM